MKEIPMAYVKANQTGIVVGVLLAFAFQLPWLVALLWAVQVAGLIGGGKWNLFVTISNPFLLTKGKETQAAELTKFNNALAVIFLTVSLAAFALGWNIAGYIFTGFLLLAAGAALLGYCIGCTIYYQYKIRFR
ncbi:hypothetical protein GCM10008018_37500 [Paenibacillus marchantiophytorum]|uniref:DUF4395 domain-containing protein n=1 Tax=Paenibacillus marchantiophytorum TaxID=1619310 RepID=A0ABQ1EUB2_9BACL|nr:DUF4395 domain-containing protein [Paenibacillus marchantiophytorum]GFZ87842.1 hypothetical protein GCM10008018_37500 [Paenibacillus marchantiophytorum]